jgi:LysR family hydrogen peroxide-inducible transcriptional activator
MDFQIRYSRCLAEAGSFSAGARRFVTQPTLSAAIAALEAELGFAFWRSCARALTPRGEEVLRPAAISAQGRTVKAAPGGKSPAVAA